MCRKNFKSFHKFLPRNCELNVKKNVSRDKGAWLIASKFRDPCSKSMGRRNVKSTFAEI